MMFSLKQGQEQKEKREKMGAIVIVRLGRPRFLFIFSRFKSRGFKN